MQCFLVKYVIFMFLPPLNIIIIINFIINLAEPILHNFLINLNI